MTSPSGISLKTNNNWESLADIFYPVGSIFISTDVNLSPASFIGGQWARINGVYLRCVGDNAIGTFGGSDQITWRYGLDWLSFYGSLAAYDQEPRECFFGLWDDNSNSFAPGETVPLQSMSGEYNSNLSPGTYINSSVTHKGRRISVTKSINPSYYGIAVWSRIA